MDLRVIRDEVYWCVERWGRYIECASLFRWRLFLNFKRHWVVFIGQCVNFWSHHQFMFAEGLAVNIGSFNLGCLMNQFPAVRNRDCTTTLGEWTPFQMRNVALPGGYTCARHEIAFILIWVALRIFIRRWQLSGHLNKLMSVFGTHFREQTLLPRHR